MTRIVTVAEGRSLSRPKYTLDIHSIINAMCVIYGESPKAQTVTGKIQTCDSSFLDHGCRFQGPFTVVISDEASS